MNRIYYADQVIQSALGLTRTEKKYKAIIESGHIGERDLISLRSAMKNSTNLVRIVKDVLDGREISIDLAHQQKGIEYLKDQWKTPTGKIRENNPFNDHETKVISNYSHFTLVDIMDIGTGMPHFVSVFRCYARGGASFKYYWNYSLTLLR